MATAPVPPDWTNGEVATDTKMDEISAAISFLRSPPRALLGRSTDQNVSNETHTALKWTSEVYDTENGHDNTTNNERYTAAYDGHYLLNVHVPISINSSAFKAEVYFVRSDGFDFGNATVYKSSTNTTAVLNSTAPIELTTGQYIEAYMWHNRGSSIQVDSSYYDGPKFFIKWFSA